MNIYKISCYSPCGTYFQPYLQSVTVIAETQVEAFKYAKDWMRKNGKHFLEEDEERWEVERMMPTSVGVVDWTEDSDY